MSNFIKLLNINQVLLICWIINFFLIGTFISPIDINNLNLGYLIDTRGNFVILSILINISILVFLTFNKKKFLRANILAFLFIIFSLLQTLSYYFFSNELTIGQYSSLFILTHIFFIISQSLIVTNIILINNNKIFQNIIKYSIATVVFILFFIIIKAGMPGQQMSLQITDVENLNININGFTRLILLVYLFVVVIFIEKKINFLSKIILLGIIILTNYYILILQSRMSILLFIVGTAIVIFFDKNNKINQKLLNLILIFGIPLLIFSFQFDIKKENISPLKNKKINLVEKNNLRNLNLCQVIDSLSTGRINKWIFLTKEIYENKSHIFLGLGGPQIDRLIFLKNYHNYQINLDNPCVVQKKIEGKDNPLDYENQGQDAANGAIYSIISAGILGLSIHLSIIFLLIFLLYKIFFKINKNYSYLKSEDIYFKYSLLVTISLILRSFLENGFMVWGIDQIFFLMCASYVINYYYYFKKI